MPDNIDDLEAEISDAVQWYWETRAEQEADSVDSVEGRHSSTRGGGHLDGFEQLIQNLLLQAGVPEDAIKHDYYARLPGTARLRLN